ncbi:DUF4317 family protein [Fonticella tunisiensis]|uniref:Uncharacterized protein DUF4317 n=1 Tax=Fonticella tunisiensis TaxID=1096341 RepID=A0A4V3ES12_9CLOT|nr:DUF4317 family protein [Fonticella tunisiensis]TDT51054.1 uncharacterized protein DUF4317 [Fonticella tunisiensis]
MNKKELGALRKEFKQDTYKLQIKELYSVYIKKDSGSVIHTEFHYFDQLDEEMKELHLKNFKKVLSGTIDTKLFELDFENTGYENHTQSILYNAVQSNDTEVFIQETNKIIEKLIECYNYDTDIVATMIRAEYMINVNKKAAEYDEGRDDIMKAFDFMLCSLNKIDVPKKALRFDFRHREFSVSSVNDAIINLNSPVLGFMFPLLSGGQADVNKVLFYNSKVKELNKTFIEGVLNCSIKMDAEAERNTFTTILQTAIGDTIKPEIIQEIYERINEVAACCDEEEGEVPTVGLREIKLILENIGVGNSNELERAFETYAEKEYNFKVQNVVPDFNSKSIKIESESANITVTPKDLNTIRQIKDKRGRKCLLIELTEDIVIDGFRLETVEEEI